MGSLAPDYLFFYFPIAPMLHSSVIFYPLQVLHSCHHCAPLLWREYTFRPLCPVVFGSLFYFFRPANYFGLFSYICISCECQRPFLCYILCTYLQTRNESLLPVLPQSQECESLNHLVFCTQCKAVAVLGSSQVRLKLPSIRRTFRI